MGTDRILVKGANGSRSELFDDGTRMLFVCMGGYDVTTLHRRTEVYDTYRLRHPTMANDTHGLHGKTHEMAFTALQIRLHAYI